MKTGQILKQKSEVLLNQGEHMLSIQATDGCPAQAGEEICLIETWSGEGRPAGPHSKKAVEGILFAKKIILSSLNCLGNLMNIN